MRKFFSNTENIAFIVCFITSILIFVEHESIKSHIRPAISNILTHIGSLFFYLVNAVLIVILLLLATPLRHKKIGGDNAQIEFKLMSWISMLFATGMGSGLIFWGVAEPSMHLVNMPIAPKFITDPQPSALSLTYLNWGIHAWALYGAFGILLGKVFYDHTSIANIGKTATTPMLNRISNSYTEHIHRVINIITITAIFFGLVGTVANSTLLLRASVGNLLNTHQGVFLTAAILIMLFTTYLLSSLLGLKRGIRSLSFINMSMAIFILVIVIALSPLLKVFKLIFSSSMEYFSFVWKAPHFLSSNLQETEWANFWTYNYYFWWLAWGPFVGVFLARISHGRPLWQYILGVIFIPTLFSVIWFSFFAGTAFNIQPEIVTEISQDYTQGLFIFFNQFGTIGEVAIWVSLLLLLIFVATSADSAIYVIREIGLNKSRRNKTYILLWSLALILSSAALLIVSDEAVNRTVAIFGAIPFLFVFILQIINALYSIALNRVRSSKNLIQSNNKPE